MAAYQEYRDEEVSSILIDEELSEKGKLLRIKNHYKARLFSSGRTSQAIQFVEKEIREEILYEQKRIQTAFNNLSFSRNEANENLAMGNISLMREALGYALAEIANEITKSGNVAIPIKDQHEFNEAKKTGREVDEIKGIHADQLKKAQDFYNEAKSWGMLLWGGFIAILIGTYIYMYSPVIMQMIHGIGQSGTEEAKRTEKLVSGIASIIGGIGWIAGLGILFYAGIKSFFYPIALVVWLFEWISIRAGLVKTQSYNGEAKKQAFRALLWAVSPSILLLGLAGYYIFQPFKDRPQTAKTNVTSSFQANALINLNRNNEPIRDAPNASGNTIETLAANTPIFILSPGDKKRWYEVQTQSGKTGWIDGYGFRLASSSEIASYSGGTNTNPNVNGLPPPGAETISNTSSNSSEIALASPLPNPFVEQPPPPPPPPPAPSPIENPDMVFSQKRLDFISGMEGALKNYTIYSHGSMTSQAMANFISPVENPLKKVINNCDEELLHKVETLIYNFHNSISIEVSSLQSDAELKATLRNPNENFEFYDSPEKQEFLSTGEQYTRRKLNQIVQMLNEISNSSQRSSKISLIEQYSNQLNKENETSRKRYEETKMRRKEANLR